MVKLKAVRLEKKLTLAEVSRRSGVAYKALWDIERGGDVKLSTLRRIAKAMDCKVSEIVD